MKLIEVTDKSAHKAFMELPWFIYQNDANWIPHLRQDIEKIFDKDENKIFREGNVCVGF